MATTTALAVLANEAGWKNRVKYYVIKAALAVMTEDVGTTNHTERVAYSKKVLAGTASFDVFSIGVLTNATIAASQDPAATTDNDLEFTVNSMFTSFALSAAV